MRIGESTCGSNIAGERMDGARILGDRMIGMNALGERMVGPIINGAKLKYFVCFENLIHKSEITNCITLK